jgi:elongation factor G
MGDVIGTISARSGRIKNTSSKGNSRVIEADIPLRTVFGYTTELRGRTQGRASPSMRFSHYEICPLKPSELK